MRKPLKIHNALISVYDKTGVVELARALHEELGIELISTGGTAATLRQAGLPVRLVEEITGSPEMLDGRVKTLHPRIHAAILADRDRPEHMRQLAELAIEPIDMVVVSLYPFREVVARPDCSMQEAIEMIDIGGPCLLRAAAKNHQNVVVLPDLDLAPAVLEELRRTGDVTPQTRRRLAAVAFALTTRYDRAISEYLTVEQSALPAACCLWLKRVAWTRYGENPGQAGAVYVDPDGPSVGPSLLTGQQVADCGPPGSSAAAAEVEMSFNNYLDATAALELCAELARAASSSDLQGRSEAPRVSAAGPSPQPAVCCIIKHSNPCGVAVDTDRFEAYRKAYLGDPNAAMGGILAVSFEVDVDFAQTVMETYQRWGKDAAAGGFFVEVWVAPAFQPEAIGVIRARREWGKRVRLVSVGDLSGPPDPRALDLRPIAGGLLLQTKDLLGLDEGSWRVATRRPPTQTELADLRLAWLICKHTRSNAITICRDGMLIGNGVGQMSRVMSCRIATWLAHENGHAGQLKGAAAASDAFFPFADGPAILADAGVTALIQPGGSKRDPEVIRACDDRGLTMILTGARHFRH